MKKCHVKLFSKCSGWKLNLKNRTCGRISQTKLEFVLGRALVVDHGQRVDLSGHLAVQLLDGQGDCVLAGNVLQSTGIKSTQY